MDTQLWSERPGNTPVESPPADYAMGGTQRWFTLQSGPEAGAKMYVSDQLVGGADAEQAPVILFVHGNPESSYTYRKVIAELKANPPAGGVRIVAPDHIGFGLSDQARHEMVDMHHAANLIQLVEALDLRNICLVVHDWGGPIGVGALLLNAPERVAGLMVLNTTVFPIPKDGMTYENYPIPVIFPWARSAHIPNALWGTHAMFAHAARKQSHLRQVGLYARFMLRHRSRTIPSGESPDLAVFRDQFATRKNALSSRRMVRQTPVWGWGYSYDDPTRGVQDNHDFYRGIQDAISAAWGPAGHAINAAIVVGGWDPLGKQSVLDQWQDALPQAKGHVQRFPEDGHFIEELRPREIAAAITGLVVGD